MSKNHGNGSGMGPNETFEDRVDSLKDSVRGLADVGTERANELKERVVEAKTTVVQTAETYATKLAAMIKDSPLLAVGIAFGVGYFAMRIVRR